MQKEVPQSFDLAGSLRYRLFKRLVVVVAFFVFISADFIFMYAWCVESASYIRWGPMISPQEGSGEELIRELVTLCFVSSVNAVVVLTVLIIAFCYIQRKPNKGRTSAVLYRLKGADERAVR
jgi:hypothetical protein